MVQQLQTMVRRYTSHEAFQAEASRVAPLGWSVAAMTEQVPRAGCLRILLLGPLTAAAFRPKSELVVTYHRLMAGDASDAVALAAFRPPAPERRPKPSREGPNPWPRYIAAALVGYLAFLLFDLPGAIYERLTSSMRPLYIGDTHMQALFALTTLVVVAVWFYTHWPWGQGWEAVRRFALAQQTQVALAIYAGWTVGTWLLLIVAGSP